MRKTTENTGADLKEKDAPMPSGKENNPAAGQTTRRFALPTAFSILFFLLILAAVATWFIPAGSYAKLTYDAQAETFTVTSPDKTETTLPATQASLDQLQVQIQLENFTSGTISNRFPSQVPTQS